MKENAESIKLYHSHSIHSICDKNKSQILPVKTNQIQQVASRRKPKTQNPN